MTLFIIFHKNKIKLVFIFLMRLLKKLIFSQKNYYFFLNLNKNKFNWLNYHNNKTKIN